MRAQKKVILHIHRFPMKNLGLLVLRALERCTVYSASIFLTYCASCLIGILMSHCGNDFALDQRDKIVGTATHNDKASINYQSGNNFTAVLYDCAGNILYAAAPQSALGLTIVLPYGTVAYQGWIGGIVSVDNAHRSRLRNIKASAYYIIVLLLQFIAFSLSIGAGIRCGVDAYKHNSTVSWMFWKYRIPKPSLQDVGYVYLVSIPMFFIASSFEFLSPWNI